MECLTARSSEEAAQICLFSKSHLAGKIGIDLYFLRQGCKSSSISWKSGDEDDVKQRQEEEEQITECSLFTGWLLPANWLPE